MWDHAESNIGDGVKGVRGGRESSVIEIKNILGNYACIEIVWSEYAAHQELGIFLEEELNRIKVCLESSRD